MARKISNSVKSTTTDHKTYITFSFFNLPSFDERLKNRPYTISLSLILILHIGFLVLD